jgi:two-component system cell cycle sensor histidine kinase/response regulator CckA
VHPSPLVTTILSKPAIVLLREWPSTGTNTIWPAIVLFSAVAIGVILLLRRCDGRRERIQTPAALGDLDFRLLFENMMEGMAHCQMVFNERQHPVDFVFLAVNHNFKRITGLEDVIGKAVTNVIPGIRDEHPDVFAVCSKSVLTGCPQKFEMEFKSLRKRFSISVYGMQNGQFVAIFDDIAERRTSSESTGELAAIVESSEYAIFSAGLDGAIKTWNAGAERLYCYMQEEALGLHTTALAPFAKESEWRERFQKVVRGQPVQNVETQGMRKDGSVMHICLSSAPIRNADQQIVAVSFTARGTTEQKHREERLQLLGAAFAAAANSITIATKDGTILWTNPAFTTLTGYATEEVVDGTLRLLRSGEHPVEFYTNLWTTILSGHVWSGEVINRRKDRTLYTEEMTITPIRSNNGGDLHFVAVTQDVTRRNSLEAQLRHAHKMEAVGRLAGGIAHDFNNLLGVIGGYAEILQDQIGDDTTLAPMAHEIRAAVNSAATLVAQLLAFGRKQLLQPQVVDLNLVVNEVAQMLRRVISEDIILSLDLALDAGNVEVDPGQLQQVIMNLAGNARDAMGTGGTLTITTRSGVLDCDCVRADELRGKESYVTLSLRDTGVGMDAETRLRAFEPFFTTKPLGQGTGLGLATVYGIVKQSGGCVCLSSKSRQGTVANVHFARVDRKAPRKAEQLPRGPSPTGTETILLVEDYGSLRDVVRVGLEKGGYSVMTAESGPKALDIVKSYNGRIHLLVTDVIMPEMDGPQLASQIAAQQPEIRVLYMSGYANEVLGQHGVVDSDVAFIKKPFEVSMLLAKIREALESTSVGNERPNYPAA